MGKKELLEYFQFTRKERIGILALLFVILSVLVFPHLFLQKEEGWNFKVKEFTSPEVEEGSFGETDNREKGEEKKRSVRASFEFDPNVLPDEGWKKLGISDRKVRVIRNFLSKGGRFNKATDIGRIYGLTREEIDHLVPLARIRPRDARQEKPFNNYRQKSPFHEEKRPSGYPVKVQLNLTDTSELIALPGIGARLAVRIINFRNKLGGFYSVEQVAETFGLPDSTFQKIKGSLVVDTAALKKLDLNTCSLTELQQHPYIRYQVANAIVQYRNQHGSFRSVSDLEKIMTIDAAMLTKLRPYVVVKQEISGNTD